MQNILMNLLNGIVIQKQTNVDEALLRNILDCHNIKKNSCRKEWGDRHGNERKKN